MPTPNEIIQSLLNTTPNQGPTVENTFAMDENPSLSRIATNGKLLTQNISKLTQTLKSVLQVWGVS